jgi:hypothetical protein
MAEKSRPVLNPVLRFTKDARPESVSGGGKSAAGIRSERLLNQRKKLATVFREMAATAENQPRFAGRAVMYAEMFDDSLAPSWTPRDLFAPEHGAKLIAPFRSGYLVEIQASRLKHLADHVEITNRIVDRVDISRIKSARFFDAEDASGALSLDEAWSAAPKVAGGRAFMIWMMPFRDEASAEHLLQRIVALREAILAPMAPMLADIETADAPAVLRRSLARISEGDRLNAALRTYRRSRRAVTTVVVPNRQGLSQLVASGAVYKLAPIQAISATSPGVGKEPNRPLPGDLSSMPVVGVVDGGLTAPSYMPVEAWRAPAFVKDVHANTVHGNQVTSLIVQGHDWNNQLALPELYCQVGTAQAVPKNGSGAFFDEEALVAYLDGVMGAYPQTKVWNLSFNQNSPCELDSVSYLGHAIASLARKHGILPIISVGNKPGAMLQPPADCEAAITIGGRLHDKLGNPSGTCPVSLTGPGPSSMLKPDLSHFSHVRVLGGVVTKGSSFATALTSPLAAHTLDRLRDPSPDLAKALLLHGADGEGYHPAMGFGTPGGPLPWECPPGVVTLQWKAQLRPGAAYYWDLPIPPSLRKAGKLVGQGRLTAILNPHPLVTEFAGPNYFSTRIATALQYQRNGKTHNLLGSLDTDKVSELTARAIDHKWSPVRHHVKAFNKAFDGDTLRVYARTFVRDLYLHGYTSAEEVPEMEAVFVLSLSSGNESDDIYNELRAELGAFVETATVEIDLEVDNL